MENDNLFYTTAVSIRRVLINLGFIRKTELIDQETRVVNLLRRKKTERKKTKIVKTFADIRSDSS